MSLDDLGIIGDYEEEEELALHIDGDIVVYQPCCIFNEDDDQSRRQIAKYINQKIDTLMAAAGCRKYILFLTTQFNFRDDLVDDYKANRDDKDRPVNLAWAKRWAVDNLNSHFHKKMEADDLLGTHQHDGSVIWSLDKDLRQIPGKHLDDATQKVVVVSENGKLRKIQGELKADGKRKPSKTYFDGLIGFYYQLLIGDSTDHIIGCGVRLPTVVKSGAKKGETVLKRKGIGPAQAYEILLKAGTVEKAKQAVGAEYFKIFGDDWQEKLETQANLLFMVRWQQGEVIKRWTFDGRDEYFDLVEGVILEDYTPDTGATC